MWGRATLTIVVSSTTMSWDGQDDEEEHRGTGEAAPEGPGAARIGMVGGRVGARLENVRLGMVFRPFRWYRDK